MASYLHHTATTSYLCCVPALEDSEGAGCVGLAAAKIQTLFKYTTKNVTYFSFFILIKYNSYFCLTNKSNFMENQQTSQKSIMINYGLILGVLTILVNVIAYMANGIEMERPFWEKALGWVVFIGVIFMAIIKFREANNGNLKLGQAIKTGLGVALIGGLITGIYVFVFFNYIEPTALDSIMEMTQEKMLEQNPDMTDEQMDMALKMTKMFMSPTAMIFMTIIGNLIMGLIVSLIAGLILKREEQYI